MVRFTHPTYWPLTPDPFDPMQSRRFLLPLFLIAVVTVAKPALAAGTVELELVGDQRGSALLFQEWAQALSKAGVQNVRFRVAEDFDKLGIETRGTAQEPIYVVTGIVRSHSELILPGGRFGPNDAGRLKQWLQELAERSPNTGKAADKEENAVFGLRSAQFDRVREDLADAGRLRHPRRHVPAGGREDCRAAEMAVEA